MNYLELNWPALPNDIENKLLKFCQTIPDNEATNLIKNLPPGAIQEFFQFSPPEYLIDWIKENIQLDGDYVVKLQVWRHSDYGRRHIDTRRNFSYNYLLMDHQGITRWFEEDGTLIESVRYEYKKWYKHIGGEKYHDVLHVNNFRPAITIYYPTVNPTNKPVFWSPIK